MKRLTEGQADPDFLASLDRQSNIIICVPPTEEDTVIESESFPDNFIITLPNDCNLSAPSVVSVSLSVLADTIRPSIKIGFPMGIKMQFNDYLAEYETDVFWKIYKSFNTRTIYNDDETVSRHIIDNIVLTMYVDAVRIREFKKSAVLTKGSHILDFNFTWYAQTSNPMPMIENIYLIHDQHIYEAFNEIF